MDLMSLQILRLWSAVGTLLTFQLLSQGVALVVNLILLDPAAVSAAQYVYLT